MAAPENASLVVQVQPPASVNGRSPLILAPAVVVRVEFPAAADDGAFAAACLFAAGDTAGDHPFGGIAESGSGGGRTVEFTFPELPVDTPPPGVYYLRISIYEFVRSGGAGVSGTCIVATANTNPFIIA
ncbi:hypothetical protein MMYC01_204158 [Madurella mycetomatis]|uniref:Uncharacterized protein n=1 Tax=Madurella mycetomatis TaxID=100816 RepID=A0A175W5W2_9PEZI|nr:hypothetical protein MMYC01_204158 [Madurella mycetomatis]